jgi:hypothetical protein
VQSTLDAEPPGRALFRVSGKDLDSFTKVAKRMEKGPFLTRSTATAAWISRTGSKADKSLMSFEAVGATGDYYWVMSWMDDNAPMFARDQQALISLVDIMNVELAS